MSGALTPALLVALERRVRRRRGSVLSIFVTLCHTFFFLLLFFLFLFVTHFTHMLAVDVAADRHFAVVAFTVASVLVELVLVAADGIQVAIVASFRRMDDLSVTSKGLRVDEGLGAVCAGVGPFPSVAQPVALEAG